MSGTRPVSKEPVGLRHTYTYIINKLQVAACNVDHAAGFTLFGGFLWVVVVVVVGDGEWRRW